MVFATVACLGLFATYALQTWHARTVQLRQTTREATNVARSLSLQAGDAFRMADALLLNMRSGAAAGVLDNTELRRLLDTYRLARIDDFPMIYALAVVDRNGRARASTQRSGKRSLNFSDREYFLYHRAHKSGDLHIGPPIASKVDGAWIVTATRRFDRKNGTFGGLVEVKLSVRFFQHVYGGVDVGKTGIIVLSKDDGTILVRKPDVAAFRGSSIAKGRLFRLFARAAAGSSTGTSALDGVYRLSAFQRIDGFPLITIVGFARSEVLADWQFASVINLGLIGFIVAMLGFLGHYLASQIRQRKNAQERLTLLASIDGLTGIGNRRHFDVMLERSWRRAIRERTPLALLMLDADNFKAYNDRYGHLEGDDALKSIARCIVAGVHRPDDFGARYGGEEFAILLPATPTEGAISAAERIRCAVAATRLTNIDGAAVTVSIGVASMFPRAVGLQGDLIVAADAALYEAKKKGRNRTEFHAEPLEELTVLAL